MTSSLFLILSTLAITNAQVTPAQYGTQANVGSHKYAAALYDGGFFRCSGAIVNERFIVTAGHCMCIKPTIAMKVIVGVVRVTNANDVPWLDIQRVHCYDSFKMLPNEIVYEHDIGLIKLKDALVMSDTIQPIPLAIDCNSYRRTGCKLVLYRENDKYDFQWGTSIHDMDLSLRWAPVEITSCEDCLRWNILAVNEICALNLFQNESFIRRGDSGSPIVCNDKLFGILVSTIMSNDIKGATILMVAPYLRWMANIVDPPK